MDCPILRNKVRTHGTLDLATGEYVAGKRENVQEPCGVPLFGKARERGTCDSCARGWETAGNTFANPEDRP